MNSFEIQSVVIYTPQHEIMLMIGEKIGLGKRHSKISIINVFTPVNIVKATLESGDVIEWIGIPFSVHYKNHD